MRTPRKSPHDDAALAGRRLARFAARSFPPTPAPRSRSQMERPGIISDIDARQQVTQASRQRPSPNKVGNEAADGSQTSLCNEPAPSTVMDSVSRQVDSIDIGWNPIESEDFWSEAFVLPLMPNIGSTIFAVDTVVESNSAWNRKRSFPNTERAQNSNALRIKRSMYVIARSVQPPSPTCAIALRAMSSQGFIASSTSCIA